MSGTDLFPGQVVSGELDLAHAACTQCFGEGVVAQNPALRPAGGAIASAVLASGVVAAAGMLPSVGIDRAGGGGGAGRGGGRDVVRLWRHRNGTLTSGGY